MPLVGSKGVAEELLEADRFSRSSTHCTVCVAAVSASVTACDGDVFRSLCSVAKADCAVDRSPDPIAVPNAFKSVENCELTPALDEEPEAELLPPNIDRF
jgi:hypothetical protein